MSEVDPIAVLTAALLGGGGVAAVKTWRRAGAEKDSIAARTLIEVNEELRRELVRRDKEIENLRAHVASLQAKLISLQNEVDELARTLQHVSAANRRTPPFLGGS